MSRNINVNPGHYKVAGRERQGEDIIQQDQKQLYASQQPGGGHHGDVPPWEATRHSFATAQPEPEQKPVKARKKSKPAKKTRKPAARKAAKRKTMTRATGRTAARGSGTRARSTRSTKKRPAPKRSASKRRR